MASKKSVKAKVYSCSVCGHELSELAFMMIKTGKPWLKCKCKNRVIDTFKESK